MTDKPHYKTIPAPFNDYREQMKIVTLHQAAADEVCVDMRPGYPKQFKNYNVVTRGGMLVFSDDELETCMWEMERRLAEGRSQNMSASPTDVVFILNSPIGFTYHGRLQIPNGSPAVRNTKSGLFEFFEIPNAFISIPSEWMLNIEQARRAGLIADKPPQQEGMIFNEQHRKR